jgi:DNA replication protein DnaC
LARLEKEEIRRETASIIRGAGIPIRYKGATLADFDENVVRQVSPFIEGQCQGVFIHGPVGTGKTHLGVALVKAAVENAVRAQRRATLLVTSAPALLSEIRSSFRDGSALSEDDLIRRYASVEFLLVDDLGVERGTDFAVQVLYLIIDARYTAMRRTVFTSNLNVEEIAGRLGDRIASRICGMGTVLLLDGRDRRLEG